MSFGIPVRNGLALGLTPSTTLASGRIGGRPALLLNFISTTALPSTITFSRGTQATLTDSTGKITYAPNNLLTNSESFEASSWTVDNGGGFNPVVTANAGVAPNGTTTADRVVLNRGTGTFSRLAQSVISVPSVTYIFSVWMRTFSGGSANVGLRLDTTGINCAVTGTWQRFFVSAPATVGTISGQILSFTSIPGTDATADILVWGAQLEAVTYQTTPGTYNSTTPKNLLGYTQEFDNAAWTKSNSFVQTNLLTYSQDFNNAAWGTGGTATVTANVAVAPDGTSTADLIVPTTANTYHYVSQNTTFAASTTYTRSVYAKPAGYNWLLIQTRTLDNVFRYAYFNVATGAVGTSSGVTSASATAVGNGWYRCSIVFASGTGAAADNMSYQCCPADNSSLFAGDGTSGMYLWGAQVVQGATAGNYQPTYAAAAAVQYAAPDGTLSADKLVEDTAASTSHRTWQAPTTAAAAHTFSVYLKAAERSFALIYAGVTNVGVMVNLSTGTTNAVAGITAPTFSSVTDVGNGWYRCAMTFTTTAAANSVFVYLANNSTSFSYTGDGTSGIYVWGAQLSNSASLDPYVYNPGAAPTSAAYYGPRFDYDPVTLAPKGLLIEEQRTNLVTYSEQFDNAAWQKSSATVTANATASPDGTTTADKLISNSGVFGAINPASAPVITTSTVYCYTVYAKAAGYDWLRFQTSFITGTRVAWFNLATGVVGTVQSGLTATVTNVGNGWYRCTVSGTSNNTNGSLQLGATTADGTASNGDGTSGIFIWGAQLEAGAFATSYIPTVASTVTRSADVASMLGDNFASWYNQTQGTFAVTFTPDGGIAGTSARVISTNSGGVSNRVVDISYLGTNWTNYNGTTTTTIGAGSTTSIPQKISAAYASANYGYVLNGGAVATNNATLVNNPNRMSIGSLDGANYLNGHFRAIQYYNTRLTNTQLQALTA